jgi:arsenic resistance protein ArsH
MSCCTPKTPQGVCCAPKRELAADAPCCGAEAAGKVTRVRELPDPDHLPALDARYALDRPALDLGPLDHSPRILLLYGSLRAVSYSRAAVGEAARLLRFFGAEPRIFDPSDLPFPDQMKGNDHPAIHELRELSIWSEGQVWCSPERHGQITGLMKAQIDHLPLALGGVRPTQGRTLAVMQVSGGSQSFNAVNTPARPVDAHGHDPESVERGEGLR